MKKKPAKRTTKNTPKWESSEKIAARLGVAPSTVYGWRAEGRMPKNPLIRVKYLKLTQGSGK